MALSFSAAESLGDWHIWKFDREEQLPIELRVRPMSTDAQKEIDRKYQNLRFAKFRHDRRFGAKRWILTEEARTQQGQDYDAWMWTDCRNLFIRAEDERTATLLSEELKEAVGIGKRVCLDTRLTDRLKRALLQADIALGIFITKKGLQTEEEEAALEEALEKNSSSISDSAEISRS